MDYHFSTSNRYYCCSAILNWLFYAQKNQEQLDELEVRKEALFDLPVFEEIDDIKKMHLVGQSQNSFVNGINVG